MGPSSMWARRRRQPKRMVAERAVSDQTGVALGTAKAPPRRYLSWTVLAMMTVGSVGYLGSAPATSADGTVGETSTETAPAR